MQARARTTRRYLLEAAARLFHERGYVGTSISDISAESGRTSGAIYFHFVNKERLALAILEEHHATWPGLIGTYMNSDCPALEKLVGLSFEVARAFRDDPVVRAGARLWAERAAIDAPLPASFVGWFETVTELLEQAAESGELNPAMNPAVAARGVVSAFFGLHTISDALDGREHIESGLHDLWLLLLHGLQADPDPAALLERVRRSSPPEPLARVCADA
ncbi:TetR family transcriptional regulator [Streptomyces sp. 150FB]|uniref:ScbR family autoregulator-binding transcription factor n=1 Tax=Streptomyces sp. 150FB TaxID=1576605 RepID=UPI00058966D8|nr:ScbR family autoregulator-binding transcription factor [Streptomyces sp. 150FB]KIF79459.1 TetR family transcriptional regulator [Streptomyces sp. 150FB]